MMSREKELHSRSVSIPEWVDVKQFSLSGFSEDVFWPSWWAMLNTEPLRNLAADKKVDFRRRQSIPNDCEGLSGYRSYIIVVFVTFPSSRSLSSFSLRSLSLSSTSSSPLFHFCTLLHRVCEHARTAPRDDYQTHTDCFSFKILFDYIYHIEKKHVDK